MDMNPVPSQTTADERLLLLALALDTRTGLAFDEIARTGLLGDPAQTRPEALRRTFALYRRQLGEMGIRVVEARYGGDARYRVDARLTYADPQDIDLTAEEAVTLVALLSLYLGSPGGMRAPYAFEVGKARDKIAAAAGLTRRAPEEGATGHPTRGGAPGDGARDRMLAKLLDAYTEQLPASFRYRNARGEAGERHVHVYGMFERMGHTYVVGRDTACPGPWREAVRVFRDDRIEPRSVKVAAQGRYEIPAGFSVGSYMRLPFQYGDEEPFRAVFAAPAGCGPHAFDALTEGGGGTWEDGPDGRARWTVEATSLDALASWSVPALAQGLVPCAPQRLLDALDAGLARTEETHA